MADDLLELFAEAHKVIEGLLEIARHAMPDSYWQSDGRIKAARVFLGPAMPTEEELDRRFEERAK